MICSTIKTAKILVVDDDPVNRRFVAQTLARAGFGTTEASNGKEALRRLDMESFGTVVSDVGMPHMNGIELLQNVHARFPRLPVILMTGCIEDEIREAALTWGATALFQKPVDRNDLILAVRILPQETPPWDCEFFPASPAYAEV